MYTHILCNIFTFFDMQRTENRGRKNVVQKEKEHIQKSGKRTNDEETTDPKYEKKRNGKVSLLSVIVTVYVGYRNRRKTKNSKYICMKKKTPR